MRALLYLEYRTVVNHLKLTLRSPKRLIPFLFVAAWLLFIFRGPGTSGHAHSVDSRLFGEIRDYVVYVRPALFGAIALMSSLFLLGSFKQSLIAFRQNEMDFLIPSGLDRRLIMGSKLLGLIVKSLGLPVIFTILWMPPLRAAFASGSSGTAWLAYLAFYVYGAFFLSLYTLVNLIGTYRPGGRWWVSLAVRGLAISAAVFPIVLIPAGLLLRGNAWAYLMPALRSPITTTLLFPAEWLADLVLGVITGWNSVLIAEFGGLAILAAVMFYVVINRKENPYEPSLISAVGLAAMMAASHSGELEALAAKVKQAELKKIDTARTAIPPFGRGAWALVWKSAVSLRRGYFGVYIGFLLMFGAFIALPKIVMLAMGTQQGEFPSAVIGILCLVMLVFIGSLVAMHELRRDLGQVNIVKPMPIRAWHMMAAEAALSTAVMTSAAWFFIAELAVLYGVSVDGALPVLAVTVPFVIGACVCVQLPISVIYPNWEEVAEQSTGAFLSLALSLAALGLSLLVGIGLWGLGLWRPAVALAVILFASAITVAGVACATMLYQRYDPTDG